MPESKEQGVKLRPNFQNPSIHRIGHWFRDLDIECITVSLSEWQVLCDRWLEDITIAFPVNIRQLNEIADLSSKVKLGLLVVDAWPIDIMGKTFQHEVSIWIKIDVGTHRTGLDPQATDEIDKILDKLKGYPKLHFAGFLAHAGHSYHARSVGEVQRIYDQSHVELFALKQKYINDYPEVVISLGDTPGASMVSDFGSVDELRPGNYVFYDLMQEEIGACGLDDIAVAMACPVVAVHKDRLQWVIYGGAIHFSKDFLQLADGRKCFGRMVGIEGESWSVDNADENPFIVSLSQEHGIVQCTEENFNLCNPGDLTLWLPVHSCLTADAMGAYINIDGTPIDHYRQRVHK